MKRNLLKLSAVLPILCLVLLLSGCSFNFFSIESLLSPPSLSGKNGEVQKAFNQLVGSKTVQLCTPAKGEYKSSFILFDVDGDGEEEAIVFYTDTSSDSSARLAYLDCINGTWVKASDIKGSGSGVYAVEFADFNKDGVYEIAVGWSMFENKSARIVNVYALSEGETGTNGLETVLNEYYSACHTADFNNDETDDFILVYIDDTGDSVKTYFRVFDLDSTGSMVKFAELVLDSSASAVSSIVSDVGTAKNGDFTRVFVEFIKTDASMFTEYLYWDSSSSKGVRAFGGASSTLRSSKISLFDIDGDGRFEVPSTVALDSEKTDFTVTVAGNDYTFAAVKWLNVYGDNSESDIISVFNPIHSYIFKLPWGDKVTARYDVFSSSLVFYRWSADKKSLEDELFRVTYAALGEDTLVEGMSELLSDTDGKYCYSVTEKGKKFGITDDTVVSSFIKL